MKRSFKTWIACAALALASVPSAAAEFEMKLGHANDADAESSLFHAYALQLERLVEQYSNDRIDLVIFPSFQLGSEQEMVRGTQIGTQEATLASITNISVFAKPLGLFVMPYVFESIDEARFVIDRRFEQVNEWTVEDAGLRLVSVLDAGFRNLTNSEREITSLEDLQGLKIRIPNNPIMVATFESLGIDPVPMAWGEVFNALQQQVIDGQENPYDVLLSVKFHEVQDYATDSQHVFQAAGVVVSEQWFQSLPAELQDAVRRAGHDAMWWYRGYYEPDFRAKIKLLTEEHGVTFSGKPTDYEEWVERGRSIWPDQYDFVGDGEAERGKEIMDSIVSATETYREKYAE